MRFAAWSGSNSLARTMVCLGATLLCALSHAGSVSFNTPGAVNWTVPAGVNAIKVVVTGAGGGGSYLSAGGNGAVVTTTGLPVTPGAILSLSVGGGGGGSGNVQADGGGGGSSNVNAGTANQIIAGGGGGGGAHSGACAGGDGNYPGLGSGGIDACNTSRAGSGGVGGAAYLSANSQSGGDGNGGPGGGAYGAAGLGSGSGAGGADPAGNQGGGGGGGYGGGSTGVGGGGAGGGSTGPAAITTYAGAGNAGAAGAKGGDGSIVISWLSTVSFNTPETASWTVPVGVSSVNIVATGAGGGGSYLSAGGNGAVVTTTGLPVTPGAILSLSVGGGGGGPVNVQADGGGGGSSNVNAGTANQIIAGGGGGGGARSGACAGGDGNYPGLGSGGIDACNRSRAGSGGIGGLVYPGGDSQSGSDGNGGPGGKAYGAAGIGSGAGAGGANIIGNSGGGGGGGYGGGSAGNSSGGAGGGSIGPAAITTYAGAANAGAASAQGGNGSIVISYYAQPGAVTVLSTVSPAASATVSCDSTGVVSNSTTACRISPLTGYALQAITDDCGPGSTRIGSLNADSTGYTLSNAATDSCTVSATFASTLSFSSASLSTATVGQYYNDSVRSASGGAAPYSYALGNGSSLPAGLSMNSGGYIGGTPSTASGLVSFTVQVSDSNNTTASASFNLTVLGAQAGLSLSANPDRFSLGASTTLGTSGGSGTGAVSYTVITGPCSVNGNTLSASLPGSCQVSATKAADASYSATTSAAITVTVDPSPPVLTPSATTTPFTAGGPAVQIDPGLTLTDAGTSTGTSATVRISSAYQSGQDTLAFTNSAGNTFGNIAGAFDPGSGTLTLTSASSTASVAQWQAALRAVTFNNSANTPSTANRLISIDFTDSTATSSNTATRSLAIAVPGACATLTAPLSTAPTAGLCTRGTPGTVTSNPGSFNWTCSAINLGNDSSCSVVRGYTVSTRGGAGGSIGPASQVVAYNSTAAIDITPDSGYAATLASGVGQCGGSLSGTRYTTNAITADCTVSTGFSLRQAPAAASTSNTGTISATIVAGSSGCSFDTGHTGATTVVVPYNGSSHFPQGAYQWRLTGCNSGETVTVSVTFPSLAGLTVKKYGPTPGSAGQSVFYDPSNLQISGNTATYSVTDGALGDDDLQADGAITDPVVPVVAPASDSLSVPALGLWGQAILAGLLALGGGFVARRRVTHPEA